MSEVQMQRSIFVWVQATDDTNGHHDRPVKYHSTITSPEIAQNYGVPEDVFTAYMRIELEKEESCRTLPFSLLMVLCYTAMVIGHDPIVPIHAVEEALVFDIEDNGNFAYESDSVALKAIYDVNSFTDFWSWMNRGFVPMMFIQNPGTGEASNMSDPRYDAFASYEYPVHDRTYLLNFNRIIGGIKLRQERGGYKDCLDAENQPVRNWYGPLMKQCVDGTGLYELYPEIEVNMAEFDSSAEFWLWAMDDTQTALDIVDEKEKDGWLDSRTMKVEIAIPVFNAEYGIYSLIKVMFFFNRGGHIWKRIIPYSTYAQWWYGAWNIIPDALWAAGLVNIAVTELYLIEQVLTSRTSEGWRSLKTEYMSIWNTVDWANVFSGFFVIIGYLFRFSGTKTLNDELMFIGRMDKVEQRDEFQRHIVKFMKALESEVENANVFRILLGIYPLLLVTRLFKSFAHQPRLSIVAKTISSSASDMAHFLLVFLSVFLTFAVAGVILFGRTIPDFTRFILSVNTCFRNMMGDFDWELYVPIGRGEAFAWFGGFMVGIVLLMLNMLLAIVMDAYSEQKAAIGDADTLWDELKETITQMRGQYRGVRFGLKHIDRSVRYLKRKDAFKKVQIKPGRIQDSVAADTGKSAKIGRPVLKHDASLVDLSHYEEYRLVTADILMKECDGMHSEQAVGIIEKAVLFYYAMHKETHNDEDMLQTIRKVDFSTKLLKNQYQESFTYAKVVALPEPFKKSLDSAKKELFAALDEVGDRTLQEEDYNAIAAFNRKVAEKPQDMRWTGPVVCTPLQTLEEAEDPRVKCINQDKRVVLNACRACGIKEDHDGLRVQSLGKICRVLEVDDRDNTVLCRIPQVGDVWFGLGAVARREPRPADYLHYHGQYHHHMTPQEVEDTIIKVRQEESDIQIEFGDNKPVPADIAQEETRRKMHDLETELRIGRQSTSEARQAITELAQLLREEQGARSKTAQKMQAVRRRVLSLKKENDRLAQEIRIQKERASVVASTREAYHDQVHGMFSSTQRLAARLDNARGTIPEHPDYHRSRVDEARHPQNVGGAEAKKEKKERKHRSSKDEDAIDDVASARIPREIVSREAELKRIRDQVPQEDDPSHFLNNAG